MGRAEGSLCESEKVTSREGSEGSPKMEPNSPRWPVAGMTRHPDSQEAKGRAEL